MRLEERHCRCNLFAALAGQAPRQAVAEDGIGPFGFLAPGRMPPSARVGDVTDWRSGLIHVACDELRYDPIRTERVDCGALWFQDALSNERRTSAGMSMMMKSLARYQ